MGSKPPRIRARQDNGAVPSPSASPSNNIGPLSVSALAGLVAAAFALFVLGIWLTVVLIRRKRRRRRGAVPLKEREPKLTEKGSDSKRNVAAENLEEGVDRSEESAGGKLPFRRLENTTDESKYDPQTIYETRQPSSSTKQSDPTSMPQSIVLPAFSTGSFPTASPHSVLSSSYNSPSSSSPLYTSPLAAAKSFTAPRNSRANPNFPIASAPSSGPATSNPSGPQPSTSTGRPAVRARTPSQLSKSFSIVDVPPISDLPELHSNATPLPPPTNAMVRNNSTSRKPRKLEKRRRSTSLRRSSENLRRSNAGDGGRDELNLMPTDLAGSGSDRENVGKSKETHQTQLRHANSFQLPLSDSDQSTRTIVPLSKSKSPSPGTGAPTNPPSSFMSPVLSQSNSMQSLKHQGSQASTPQPSQPLVRQRSGIRQPGDANHLRPPKDSPTNNSYQSGSATPGLLSQAASGSDQSQLTVMPMTSMQSLAPQPSATNALSNPISSATGEASRSQPTAATSSLPTANEILAFHKAAGNVPKPFKPFAFQFPTRRSPSVSNASYTRPRAGSINPADNAGAPPGAAAPAPGGGGHFAALLAAAGLSISPANSPSPSPIGRSGTPASGWVGRGSTDGLSNPAWRPSTEGLSAFPGRTSTDALNAFPPRGSTDALTAFPPRASTDALSNFAFGGPGGQESRQSLQSGYSLEVPWEGQEAAVSSPSAFSFSTDLYGYGGPGPASASNSIDLYRRVDPSSLFPTGAPSTGAGLAADMEGRHSLSLLGGEPLSAAELDSRGLRIRRFREGHASVSSFAALNNNTNGDDSRTRTRTPSWTLEALRENLFGPGSSHRRGQDSVASSSVGSQSRRSSIMPWSGLGVLTGPPALASPRDANFQFAVGPAPTMGGGLASPYAQWNQQPPTSPGGYPTIHDSPVVETRIRTVVRAFAPLLPDELVLRPGEELAVLQEFDDGWCVVAREGLGSNGAPTPPGLDTDEPVSASQPAADGSSTTGSSGSGRSRKRVLEMGACPAWVFEEAPPPNNAREYSRPMRSTSLSVTVSMRVPPATSPISAAASVRESPRETSMPLHAHPYGFGGDNHSPGRAVPFAPIVREEVISWSNF